MFIFKNIKKWGLAAFLVLSAAGASAAPADWWIDITNDRVESVRSQLAMGEDPNAVTNERQPSLMHAIQEGAWKVYDLLVQHRNIDVNAVNANDETPLMYLSVVGQTARARDLIAKGAQVNRPGWTPLHYAASRGHLDTVRLLLSHKAMVNAPSPDGTSPLMMAAFAGSTEVVRVLLDAGADVTARNLQLEDAADWAMRRNHQRLAAQLNELTAKVLSRRRAAAGGGITSTQPARVSPDVPEAASAQPPALRETQADSQAQATQSAEDQSSTSRYFDLERFDREEDLF